jgi:hypothetical protein
MNELVLSSPENPMIPKSAKNIANRVKDAAVQLLATQLINNCNLEKFGLDIDLKKLGRMTKLKINSEKQEVYLTFDLHGEQSPIELTVQYRVLTSTQIEIVSVSSSRDWIATFVNEVLPAKRKQITVPAAVTTALSKILD